MMTHFNPFESNACFATNNALSHANQATGGQMDAEMEVEEMQPDTRESTYTNHPTAHVFLNSSTVQNSVHPIQANFMCQSNSNAQLLQQQPQHLNAQHSQMMLSSQQSEFKVKAKHSGTMLQNTQHAFHSHSLAAKLPANGSEEDDDDAYEEDEEDDEADDDDDDDDDYDDLDDLDEQMVQQMLLSASAENQQAIRLLLSGYSACASETIRYLIEEERMSPNSPVLMALVQHLKMQETLLIVSCLRTQHMLAQQQAATGLTEQPPPFNSLSPSTSTSNASTTTPSQTSAGLAATTLLTSTPVNAFNVAPNNVKKGMPIAPANSSISSHTFEFQATNRQLFASNNPFNDSGFVEQ